MSIVPRWRNPGLDQEPETTDEKTEVCVCGEGGRVKGHAYLIGQRLLGIAILPPYSESFQHTVLPLRRKDSKDDSSSSSGCREQSMKKTLPSHHGSQQFVTPENIILGSSALM
jgi:hypothetical protein